MASVILFPRGQLVEGEKERLEQFGVVAIEVDDPTKVAAAPLSAQIVPSDDMLYAAMISLAQSSSASNTFVVKLKELMAERRKQEESK